MGSDFLDRRPVPRSLLSFPLPPWAMVAIAAVILVLVAIAVTRPATAKPIPAEPIEMARTIQPTRVAMPLPEPQQESVVLRPTPRPVEASPRSEYPIADPLREEERRREYESLRASNVIEQKQQPGVQAPPLQPPQQPNPPRVVPPPPPSGIVLSEGSVIEAILTNRLDGSANGPVNAMIVADVYVDRRKVIPKGSRILGTASRVQDQSAERLAIAFHRVLLPDGRSIALDKVPGLDQQGAIGVKDKVDRHYLETFGAAAAVGLLSGLGQLATGGYRRDGTVIITSSTDSVAQATSQTMAHFLNRLPTVVIREGHRLRIYLTSDVVIPDDV